MRRIPLPLGPLVAEGFTVFRSGVRWLKKDGELCRAGEVIAFCNIGLEPAGRRHSAGDPFAAEMRDFQVAFAPRAAGRVRRAPEVSRGGFLDQLYEAHLWTPERIIGHLECDASDPEHDQTLPVLDLLFLAGRRTTQLAEVRSGLLTGWHDRARAWWNSGGQHLGTVLSLGICEQRGIIRGEHFAFLEFFDAVAGPAHIVYAPDDAIVPCARIALDGFLRSAEDYQQVAADFVRSFAAGPELPTAEDLMFGATVLAALERSPLTETYDILSRLGLSRTGFPDAIILSLNAETPIIWRHKRLGYWLKCHDFRITEAGAAVRAWLRANFEPVRRTIDDVKRDYADLIARIRERSRTEFLVLNVMSTSWSETIGSYAMFERPLSEKLTSVRAKELNVMLHDLAREHGVAIVDVDAIAAELGASHMPDGIHASGLMEAEIRAEMIRVLNTLAIPGFGLEHFPAKCLRGSP